MQENISDSDMQETLYQETDAAVSISDRRSRSFYIRQWMPETLYQTADAGVSISDSGCMQVSLYQTAEARADIGCVRLYIRQRMKETLY